MTISSSDVTEVARSREKSPTDRDIAVDITALEKKDDSIIEGSSKNPKQSQDNKVPAFKSFSTRRRNIFITLLVVSTLIISPAYGERIFRGDSIAHGISVGGIDIGGMSTKNARSKLESQSKKALKTPFVFVLGKDRISISSQDLGLSYDIPDSIKRASNVADSYNPTSVIGGFFQRYTVGNDIDPAVQYDSKKFDSVAESIVNHFSKGRSNAGITIEGTQVTVVKAQSGRGVSLVQANEALRASIHTFSRSRHALSDEKVEAQITLAEAERTAAIVRTMLSENSILTTPAGNSITITPGQLGSVIAVTPKGSRLDLSINPTTVRSVLGPQLSTVEAAPTDATFSVSGSGVSVVPSIPGKQIDFSSAMTRWIKGEHNISVNVTEVEPERNTQWAQNLNITEVVSSFTTNFPAGQERIKNIRRAAEVTNNTVVVPGETFSLNAKLGRRTAESGYVKAPVFSSADGFFDDYGGGASQFSTTLFNAAFIGGYKDITHSPHSIYISRYPMGREATLNYGSIDMAFKNDSNSGILIRTSVGATSVTVTLYGNKEGRVVKLEGPVELGRTEIGTKYIDDPNLEAGKEIQKQGGYPGIVVDNFRTVDRPGKPGKKERYRWTYQMVPREVIRGTKAP